MLASSESDVILLTDTERPSLPGLVQVPLSAHYAAAARFKKLYRHASPNSYRYELFCFTRWFYLLDFMRRHGTRRCCVFDTDIMLFSSVERFVDAFGSHPAGNWSWANVISGVDVLDAICRHFERLFEDRKMFAGITKKYTNVTDMGALWDFADRNPQILNQDYFPSIGFDNDINLSHRDLFTMNDGIKSLTIGLDGVPVGKRTDGVRVPFHFLHFQGSAKALMPAFAWC